MRPFDDLGPVGPALERLVAGLRAHLDLESCVLFGSRARGEGRGDSDVDLVVVARSVGHLRPIHRSEAVYDLWPGAPALDALVYTPEEVLRLDHLVLVDAVHEGLVLWDAGTWQLAKERLAELVAEGVLAPRAWGWSVDLPRLRSRNAALDVGGRSTALGG